MGERENALATEARSTRSSVASDASDLEYFGFAPSLQSRSSNPISRHATRSQSRRSSSILDSPTNESAAERIRSGRTLSDSLTSSFTQQPSDEPDPRSFTTLGEWENALVAKARKRQSMTSVAPTSENIDLIAHHGLAEEPEDDLAGDADLVESQFADLLGATAAPEPADAAFHKGCAAHRRSTLQQRGSSPLPTASSQPLSDESVDLEYFGFAPSLQSRLQSRRRSWHSSSILDSTTNQSAAERIRSGRSLLPNEVQHSESDIKVQPVHTASPNRFEQLSREQFSLEKLHQQLFKAQSQLLQTPKAERADILDQISILETHISTARKGTDQWLAYRKQVFQRPSITANIIQIKSKFMQYATDHERDQWHEMCGSPKDGDSVQLTKEMQGLGTAYAAGQYSEDERVRIQKSHQPSDIAQHTVATDADTLYALQKLIKMLESTPKLIQLLHRVLIQCELLPVDAADHLVLPLLADMQRRMVQGSYLPQKVQWQLSTLLNAFLSFGISEVTFEQRAKPEGLPLVMTKPRLAARFLQGIDSLTTLKPTLDFYGKHTRSRMGIDLQESQCIWGVSDLHTDCKANMVWLEQLPCCAKDTILVAGDIATQIDIIRKSLELLVHKFQHVFYVPGNHDLWSDDSGSKFFALLTMCDELGVHTTAAFVGRILIFPLFSWYKGGQAGLSEDDDPGMMKAFDMACQWPSYIAPEPRGSLQPAIADFFVALNEEVLETVQRRDDTCAVISMSHFVPYKELFPGMVAMRHIMGCNEIAAQVSDAGSDVHIFGHSHVNIDNVVCGTRFIQAALGHPTDASYTASHKPKLLWDLNPALSAPRNNVNDTDVPHHESLDPFSSSS